MVVSSGGALGAWSSALSPREREVALLVARGLANKEIARELELSNGTVKLHVHSIFSEATGAYTVRTHPYDEPHPSHGECSIGFVASGDEPDSGVMLSDRFVRAGRRRGRRQAELVTAYPFL